MLLFSIIGKTVTISSLTATLMKTMWEKQDSMVYYVIQQDEGIYLLFVSSNHLYWSEERLTQNDGSLFEQ